jgi:hypothetical protein
MQIKGGEKRMLLGLNAGGFKKETGISPKTYPR